MYSEFQRRITPRHSGYLVETVNTHKVKFGEHFSRNCVLVVYCVNEVKTTLIIIQVVQIRQPRSLLLFT